MQNNPTFYNHQISIQYCINCNNHNWCTHHHKQKYQHASNQLIRALSKQFPHIDIFANVPPPHYISVNPKQNNYFDPLQNKFVTFPQTGAFEVTLDNHLIFSKKKNVVWPKIQDILFVIRMKLHGKQSSNDNKLSNRAAKSPKTNWNNSQKQSVIDDSIISKIDKIHTCFKSNNSKQTPLSDHLQISKLKKNNNYDLQPSSSFSLHISNSKISKIAKQEQIKVSELKGKKSKFFNCIADKAYIQQHEGKKEILIDLNLIDQDSSQVNRFSLQSAKNEKLPHNISMSHERLTNKQMSFHNGVPELTNSKISSKKDNNNQIQKLTKPFSKNSTTIVIHNCVKKNNNITDQNQLFAKSNINKNDEIQRYMSLSPKQRKQKIQEIYTSQLSRDKNLGKNQKIKKKGRVGHFHFYEQLNNNQNHCQDQYFSSHENQQHSQTYDNPYENQTKHRSMRLASADGTFVRRFTQNKKQQQLNISQLHNNQNHYSSTQKGRQKRKYKTMSLSQTKKQPTNQRNQQMNPKLLKQKIKNINQHNAKFKIKKQFHKKNDSQSPTNFDTQLANSNQNNHKPFKKCKIQVNKTNKISIKKSNINKQNLQGKDQQINHNSSQRNFSNEKRQYKDQQPIIKNQKIRKCKTAQNFQMIENNQHQLKQKQMPKKKPQSSKLLRKYKYQTNQHFQQKRNQDLIRNQQKQMNKQKKIQSTQSIKQSKKFIKDNKQQIKHYQQQLNKSKGINQHDKFQKQQNIYTQNEKKNQNSNREQNMHYQNTNISSQSQAKVESQQSKQSNISDKKQATQKEEVPLQQKDNNVQDSQHKTFEQETIKHIGVQSSIKLLQPPNLREFVDNTTQTIQATQAQQKQPNNQHQPSQKSPQQIQHSTQTIDKSKQQQLNKEQLGQFTVIENQPTLNQNISHTKANENTITNQRKSTPNSCSKAAPITKQFYGLQYEQSITNSRNELFSLNSNKMEQQTKNNQKYINELYNIQNLTIFQQQSINHQQVIDNSGTLNNVMKIIKILCSKNQYFIIRLFQNPSTPKAQAYAVWLCKNYHWKMFVINKPILINQNHTPAYLHHKGYQLWPVILTQALRLLFGTYNALGQASICELFHALAGTNHLTFKINQDSDKNNKLLKFISNNEKKNFINIADKRMHNSLAEQHSHINSSPVYYILSQKIANDQQIFIRLKKDNQEAFWINFQTFIKQFSQINILQLRVHHNFNYLSLQQCESDFFKVIELNFKEESFGCVSLRTEGQETNFKLFLYKEEEDNLLRLIGQVKSKCKKSTFFDCCFTEGKYLIFAELQKMKNRLAYIGEGFPTIHIKQEVSKVNMKNDHSQYIPIASLPEKEQQKMPKLLTITKKLENSQIYGIESGMSHQYAKLDREKLKSQFIDFLLRNN